MKKINKNRADLASEINELETALFSSYDNLNLVNDKELVDFYTYMIKAYESKHKYLLQKLKES